MLSVLLFSWGLFSLSKTSVLSSSLPSRWTAQKGSEGASWTPLLGEWLGPLSLHPHPQHCQPPTPAKHQCTERGGLPPPLPAWDIEGSTAGWGHKHRQRGPALTPITLRLHHSSPLQWDIQHGQVSVQGESKAAVRHAGSWGCSRCVHCPCCFIGKPSRLQESVSHAPRAVGGE